MAQNVRWVVTYGLVSGGCPLLLRVVEYVPNIPSCMSHLSQYQRRTMPVGELLQRISQQLVWMMVFRGGVHSAAEIHQGDSLCIEEWW